jgi:hypothetical protein
VSAIENLLVWKVEALILLSFDEPVTSLLLLNFFLLRVDDLLVFSELADQFLRVLQFPLYINNQRFGRLPFRCFAF